MTAEDPGKETPPLLQNPPHRSWLWAGVTLVGVIMIAGFSLLVLNLLDTVDHQSAELSASKSRSVGLHDQLNALKEGISEKERTLDVLSDRTIRIIFMRGLRAAPSGYGKIFWSPDRGSVILQVSHLPRLPQDKDYQLWLMKGRRPVSAGVFSVQDSTALFFRIDIRSVADPVEMSSWTVTLEPKGGVPLPTGETYLAASPGL